MQDSIYVTILYHEITYKLVWMIHKITSLLLQNKILIQQSLSKCPTSSSYLSQALPIPSSITPPPLFLPCKGTRTPFRALALLSPNSLKMFVCLVQATTLTSIPNVSVHMKVSLGRHRTGSLGPACSHSLTHTQNTLL